MNTLTSRLVFPRAQRESYRKDAKAYYLLGNAAEDGPAVLTKRITDKIAVLRIRAEPITREWLEIRGRHISDYPTRGFPDDITEYLRDIDEMVESHPAWPLLESFHTQLTASSLKKTWAAEYLEHEVHASQEIIRQGSHSLAKYAWFQAARRIAEAESVLYPIVERIWDHHYPSWRTSHEKKRRQDPHESGTRGT